MLIVNEILYLKWVNFSQLLSKLHLGYYIEIIIEIQTEIKNKYNKIKLILN